jgi:hypothetical protein
MRYLTTSDNCIQLYLSTLPGGCQVEYSIWQSPATTRPATFHICKTRGCYCSFRLLVMGGVSLETCSASYKYEIKFWYTVASCWIFYVNYTMMHGSTNIKVTISVKQRSWQAHSFSARQILCVLWNLKICHRVYSFLPVVSAQNFINLVPTLPSYLFKIHFNIVHSSVSGSLKCLAFFRFSSDTHTFLNHGKSHCLLYCLPSCYKIGSFDSLLCFNEWIKNIHNWSC